MRTPYEPRHRRRILCISPRYAPSFGTFHHSYPLFGGRIRAYLAHTFSKRPAYPRNPQRASMRNAVSGLALLGRIVWRVGVRGDYRRTFWRVTRQALRRGQIEELIQAAVVSHHLIEFTRQCLRGAHEASFYAPRVPAAPPTPVQPLRLPRPGLERERASR